MGEKCRQFKLLIWTSFRSFVCQVGGEERYEHNFIRVHKNLVQHPNNNTSIAISNFSLKFITLIPAKSVSCRVVALLKSC